MATRIPTGPRLSSTACRSASTWPKSVTSPVAGGAAPRELGGDGRPDASRAAREQRYLAVERAHDGSPPMAVR
ncbi:MAG: hypothetical protein ACXVW7_18375, partial [Trebonia sp.]